jgi:hypothetical protein
MRAVGRILLLLLLNVHPVYSQDKYQIDLSELEKEVEQTAGKPYHLGGFVQFEPVFFGIDRGAAFSELDFDLKRSGSTFMQYNLGLRLEGSYKKDIFSVFFQTDTLVQNRLEGWWEGTKLLQGLISLRPSPNFSLEAGNKVFRWGKGYAWSPVAFVDRPKDAEDPEELRQGVTIFTADWNQTFIGALNNVSLSAVGVPVYEHVNTQFGELNHMNFASKLYLLLYDTDIDFMVSTGSSRTTRYGFDFSRNITTNLEVHGEWARINNFKLTTINTQGVGTSHTSDAISYLLGLRYLTAQETTYILEYYHNGTGLSQNQFADFVTFVNNSYRTFRETGNDSGLKRAQNLAEGVYGRQNPMRDYLYFRASQKEPFDILYFTPALTTIINLQDGSLVVIPELTYSPITNLELRLRTPVLIGAKSTEYGAKQNDYRIDLRVRYYFGLDSILERIFDAIF